MCLEIIGESGRERAVDSLEEQAGAAARCRTGSIGPTRARILGRLRLALENAGIYDVALG